MSNGTMTFQEYNASKNADPADQYIQRFTAVQIAEGVDPKVANLNAVDALKKMKLQGINPEGPITAMEAGLNERMSGETARQLYQQGQTPMTPGNVGTVDQFQQYLMERGLPTAPTPRGTNKGWEKLNESFRNLQNLELPNIKY